MDKICCFKCRKELEFDPESKVGEIKYCPYCGSRDIGFKGKEENMTVKYYEALIILENGSVKGGYIGNTPGEADRAARDAINTGELFPSPVKVRVAKCEFISEQPAEMREKGKLLQYDPKFEG